ncbi:MAG: hypothetical protein WA954_00805 [Parerythrobacter sp.]
MQWDFMRIAVRISEPRSGIWLARSAHLAEEGHEVWLIVDKGFCVSEKTSFAKRILYLDSSIRQDGLVDKEIESLADCQVDMIVLPRDEAIRSQTLPFVRLAWDHDPVDMDGACETSASAAFQRQTIRSYDKVYLEGRALATAETRVHRHSASATRKEASRLAPFVLERAVRAVKSQGAPKSERRTTPEPGPFSKSVGWRLLGSRAKAWLNRLAYGAFVEKKWRVTALPEEGFGDPATRFQNVVSCRTLPYFAIPKRFTFAADPFFFDNDTILAEALEARSGRGRLVLFANGLVTELKTPTRHHLSYPHSVEDGGRQFVVPEMARGGDPQIFALKGDALVAEAPLTIDSGPLLDPTFVRHEGALYLFANRADEGASILRLWSATGLFDTFEEHPESPVRVDARGSRMGGSFLFDAGTLYRFGQDCERSYGDALLSYIVTRLDRNNYREEPAARIALDHMKGPHTLDFRNGHMVFDWYEERFAPFAWARRIAGRFG